MPAYKLLETPTSKLRFEREEYEHIVAGERAWANVQQRIVDRKSSRTWKKSSLWKSNIERVRKKTQNSISILDECIDMYIEDIYFEHIYVWIFKILSKIFQNPFQNIKNLILDLNTSVFLSNPELALKKSAVAPGGQMFSRYLRLLGYSVASKTLWIFCVLECSGASDAPEYLWISMVAVFWWSGVGLDFDPITFYENLFWNQRPDGILINKKNRILHILEFKWSSDRNKDFGRRV